MKTPRLWILGITLAVAACSDADDVLGPRLIGDAAAAIPPTNNTLCNKFWASGVNGLWTDPTKWNPAGVPTSGSSVCLNAAGTYTVTIQPVSPATAITVDILALEVGGAGATPTLRLSTPDATVNVAEGIVVQQNAVILINSGDVGVINAAGTITNSGTIDALAPCGGCGDNHAINADIINTSLGTLSGRTTALTLGKVDGQYSNSGTITFGTTSGLILIPASAGSVSFSQDGGLITGASNFEALKLETGTFTLNGGKLRTRNGLTNLIPIVYLEGANLVINASATDSAAIGVQALSTSASTITGNITSLMTLRLAGAGDMNPGSVAFAGNPTNDGVLALGPMDGGMGDLTIAGSGRLTNNGSIARAGSTSGVRSYHFGIEVTNNGTIDRTSMTALFFDKLNGVYRNFGLITGNGPLNVVGSTFVAEAAGTMSGTGNVVGDAATIKGGSLSRFLVPTNVTVVEPGQSPGVLTAVGFLPDASSSLTIELGGTQPGTGYDQLVVTTGSTQPASSVVNLVEINGFLSGVCGQAFDIVTYPSKSGAFAPVNGLTPAANRRLREVYISSTSPQKLSLFGFDPQVKVSVAPNPVAIAEGASGVQYAVCLDGAPALTTAQSVTITPTPNGQVTVTPPSVTFTSSNWYAPQFFTVTAVDDIANEGNHTGTVTHTATSGVAAYNGVAVAALTANITDNDVPPPSSTTTSVSSNNNPSTAGQSVTFTATVASGGGTPDGSVQFNIDGNDVGSPVTLVSGQAQFVTSTLTLGNHTVQATYGGSSGFLGSIGSLTGGQQVNAIGTTTGVGSSANPSTFGQQVTFTATVSSSGGTPTGSVQFNIDNVDVGSPVALDGSGQATHQTSSLGGGSHAVKATYAASGNFGGSFGALVGGQTVNPAGTSTAVASNNNPSDVGESVTFTATVTSGAGTPGGNVQFNIDNSNVGGPVALDGSGQATLSTSTLTVGNHAIKATYAASTNYATSFGTLSGGQVVNSGNSSTAVGSSANPSTFGQSVTFTATVTGGLGTPAGTVQFKIDNIDAGSAVTLDGNGQATLATSTLSAGNHPVTATYSGGGVYSGSVGTLATGQTVNPAGTSTAVSSSADPSTFGQSVTFTATVSSGAGTPGGTVQFNIDNVDVGSAVTLVGGQATMNTTTLGAGNHAVKATYSGAANYSGSNGTLAGGQDVNPAGTTTGVASSADPSTFGQSVTFTATVSSGAAGTPGGTVQFNIDNVDVGSAVTLVGGQATMNTTTLGVGNHAVKATYSGAANYTGSNGTLAGGQDVNPAGTTTGVTSSLNPSASGQSVTFTATVSSGAGTPGGAVQFNIDNADVGPPVTLVSGQAQFTTSTLGSGTHSVMATYGGAANYSGSNGTLAGGQVVNGASSSTATSTAASVTATPQYSDVARLRADVTPHTVGVSKVTGTVHFYMGASAVTCGSSAPAGEIGNDAIAASDNGVAYIDRQMLGASGSSTLTACFYSTNPDFLSSGGSAAVYVGKENAQVAPAASNVAAVLATGATPSASFSLVFTLRETNAESDVNAGAMPGDIDNADLTVNLLAIGSGTNNKSATCSPSATIATPPAYSDVKTFTCNFSAVAVDAYEVSAVVTGNYYMGGYTDALTVYDPKAGSVSGGGRFIYSATSNDIVSFSVSYHFTGKDNKPHGNLLAIRHLANGDECRAKSNGIGSPAVSGNAASFSGKANYSCTRPDGSTYDGAGNLSFVGWIQDNGEGSNATGPDRVWLKIDAPNSKISMPAPAATNARPLTSGNVQVRN